MERVLLAQPPLTRYGITRADWQLLVIMAKRAHDDTGLYWGGVGWLQQRMDYPQTPGGRVKVLKHWTRLETAGLIRRTDKRRAGCRVVELLLPDPLGAVENPGDKPSRT